MSDSNNRLVHFPVTFFAIIMGLSGLTLAWRAAKRHLDLPFAVDGPLFILSGLVFLFLVAVYLIKVLRHFSAVRAEFHHPIKMSFFPAFSISLILLSICMLPHSELIGSGMFWVGITVHLVLTLAIIGVWINHDKFEINHMNPAWFIPVVGNILVPIIGVPLGQVEISWFFFSIGIVFWIVLMTIFFNRIIFHNRMPPKMMPTFFILIAPPSVGFIAYLKLHPALDPFAQILFGFGLFLTLLLFTQFRWFRGLPFALSWWAYSFPSAAITIAAFDMYGATGAMIYKTIAVILLVFVTLLIASLIVRTLLAIRQHGICLPEPG